jgi:hypothetical protein
MFKTKNGKIFGIGDNSLGQLGFKCESKEILNQLIEIKIDSSNEFKLSDITTC